MELRSWMTFSINKKIANLQQKKTFRTRTSQTDLEATKKALENFVDGIITYLSDHFPEPLSDFIFGHARMNSLLLNQDEILRCGDETLRLWSYSVSRSTDMAFFGPIPIDRPFMDQ